mmetsp:Transcript_14166/g.60625  ORF Transcript_14166/g.60625 Transcript_14166/m.60625 type:complete len:213 (+) Transcript_14166:55-693(+)
MCITPRGPGLFSARLHETLMPRERGEGRGGANARLPPRFRARQITSSRRLFFFSRRRSRLQGRRQGRGRGRPRLVAHHGGEVREVGDAGVRLHVDLRVVGKVALLPSRDPQADVIFVRHGFRAAVPDDVEEVVGVRADELRALRAAVVDDGAAELLELAVILLVDREQRHGLVALELALHARDVRPDERLVVVQRNLGFAVHDDAPGCGLLQ